MVSSDASGALEEQLEVFFNWLALAGDNSAALGWLIEGEHEIGNQIVASDKQKRERAWVLLVLLALLNVEQQRAKVKLSLLAHSSMDFLEKEHGRRSKWMG